MLIIIATVSTVNIFIYLRIESVEIIFFKKESILLYLLDSKRAVIGRSCGPYSTVRPASFELRLFEM